MGYPANSAKSEGTPSLRIKACLFDLDGVLVDTAPYHFLAWQALAVELGIPFTEADGENLKGINRSQSLDRILQAAGRMAGEGQKKIWADRKNETYLEMICHMGPGEVLPGVMELLVRLRDSGIQIGLGSASRNASLILEKTGLAPFFNVLVDGLPVTRSKPDPQVFLRGAELLGVSPPDCLVFEDARAGIEAALKGGFYCVGIGSSVNLKGADLVVDSLVGFSLEEFEKNISGIRCRKTEAGSR